MKHRGAAPLGLDGRGRAATRGSAATAQTTCSISAGERPCRLPAAADAKTTLTIDPALTNQGLRGLEPVLS